MMRRTFDFMYLALSQTHRCKRCNGDKKNSKAFPADNDMGPEDVKCVAAHNCATARRTPADAASVSETVLFLTKGTKVMLTNNLWPEVGLVNGIRGEVVEIVYAGGAPAPAPPCYVVVRFDGYTGPDWSSGERYRGCVSISPVQLAWSSCGANREGNTMTRTQLPLKLCWALTTHRSQG